MFRYFESLVDPYCDYPQTDHPPQRLWPFLRGYMKPFHKVFAVTGTLTVIGAFVEVWLIAYLGRLVDVLGAA